MRLPVPFNQKRNNPFYKTKNDWGELAVKEYLAKLAERQTLTEEEMSRAAQSLFSKDISESEMAAFIIALKAKGKRQVK